MFYNISIILKFQTGRSGKDLAIIMADKNKKMVEQITSMDVDFAQWYTDVVKKAELADYSGVKGCMVIRPYGYAIWENIQRIMDAEFKKLGHENVYMPMFIPESLLQREKDHVAGFAPECAWVTVGGQNTLPERLCVRPTSETLFCEHYRNVIHSYRDLPKLYNQWCNVVRWEKTTRPFLRTSEFLWQEGHTMHETEEEAREETRRMLQVYVDFYEKSLAIPVVSGRKTEKEKFAGAEETYTVEPMMHNGFALQGGTSHYFGDGFARAFDITYTARDNTVKYPHQTSWGASTRMIGAIIMCHGDDNGLILPPAVAPIQVAIIPVAQHKEGVLDKAAQIKDTLTAAGFRAKIDDSDKTPGWKFAEQEIKGIPARIEIGPKDLEAGQAVIVRRDTREKTIVKIEEIADKLKEIFVTMQSDMLEKARKHRDSHTYEATNYEEFKDIIANKPGFVKAMWCGDLACEMKIKEDTTATSRCMPFEQEHISDVCVCCGKPAKKLVYWGKAY